MTKQRGILALTTLVVIGQVTDSAASVVLTSSANPAILGHPVTLTATITPGTAAGSVTFYDGTAVLGSRSVVGGSAVLTTALLSPSTHALTAWFNAADAQAKSAILAQVINAIPESGLGGATFPVGGGGWSGAQGDFNADGVTDLVAAIGGVSDPVLFSGLTATFAGLYQANVQVPAGVAVGGAGPVVITATDSQTGATAISNSVTIVVQ